MSNSSGNLILNEQEKRLVELIRKIQQNEIKIKVAKGIPVMVEINYDRLIKIQTLLRREPIT